MPAELFVELGMEIKTRSPFKNTAIIDLAYNCVGYIATEKAYKEGGYEVTSNVYKPEGGKIIVKAVVGLLQRLNSA